MKSVYRDRYGPPEVLTVADRPTPTPGATELLVRVRAATVNRTDCGGLYGRPFVYRFFAGFPRPRFVATGTDFAGDVEAVGSSVTAFAVGDRVWGLNDNGLGSHAEYLVIAETEAVVRIPSGVSYEVAAASAEGAHYAINFLNKLSLPANAHVLVNGATGAIGSAAVQLLRYHGVRVTAVCAGEHARVVREFGAERAVDYLTEDFTQVLRPTSEDEAFDAVFDAVGKSTFDRCKPLMKRGASYVSSELGPWGQNIVFALGAPIMAPLMEGKRVVFPIPSDCKRSLGIMNELLRAGAFRPLIDRRYPIEEIRDAFRYVESGAKIGNVVLALG